MEILPQNTIMPASSADKFNERGFPQTSFTSFGKEIINDYDGNLLLDYSTKLEFFGGDLTNISMIYNANVQHRFFPNPNNNDSPGHNVNMPEWILGINGFAVQILNFETNFFAGRENGSYTNQDLNGSEIPLIIPGYHYSNLISNDRRYDGEGSPYFGNDYIRLLKSDGSQICLRNVNTTGRTGDYKEEGLENYGYAIVEFIPNTGEIFRRLWYKPGDGLTYYFEEEFSNLVGKMGGGPYDPKVMYLKKIISPVQDTIYLHYSYNIHQDVTSITNGRKVLKDITINTFDPYVQDQRELFQVSYNVVDWGDTEKLAGLRLINWNDLILNFYCDWNGQTDLIGTIRDPNGSRRAYVKFIQDDQFFQDMILSQVKPRTYQDSYQNSTYTFKASLPMSINYQSGKTSEFEFYDEEFSTPFSGLIINLNSIVNYNNENMSQKFRDCYTNFIIKSRKQKKSEQLVKTETYNYSYTGESANVTNLLKERSEVYNIFTEIIEDNHITNGSAPTKISRLKKYSIFKTGYMDNIFGDFFKTTKLLSETIEDKSPGQSGNKVIYNLDYDILPLVNYGDEFYEHFDGKFHLNYKTEQKYKDNTAFKSITTNYTYTYEPGTKILKTEEVKDAISLRKKITYTNFIPADLFSSTDNFYKIRLVGEEKTDSYPAGIIKNYIKNIYYPETHIPQTNPDGIFKGKLRYSQQLSPIYGRETNQEYKYYPLEEDTTYKGYLKSIEYDNGNKQIFKYPKLYLAWTPLDEYEVLPQQISGKITYWDGTFKDSTFYKRYHQYKPLETITIINNGADTLKNYTSYDKRGNLLFEIDVNRNYSEFSYDKLNRLTSANLTGSFVDADTGVISQQQVTINDTLYFESNFGSSLTKYEDGSIDMNRLDIIKEYEEQTLPPDDPKDVIEQAPEGEDGGGGNPPPVISSVGYIFFSNPLNTTYLDLLLNVSFILKASNYSYLPDPSESKVIYVRGVTSDSTLYGQVSFIWENGKLYTEQDINISYLINLFKSAGKTLIGLQLDSPPLYQWYPEYSYKKFQFDDNPPNRLIVTYRTTISDTLYASGTAFYNYNDIENKIESIRRFSNNPTALNKTLEERAEYDEFGLLKNLLRKNQSGNYYNTQENTFNSLNLPYKTEDGENRPFYTKYDYLGRIVEQRYDADFGYSNRKRYYYLPIILSGELYEEQEYFDEENNRTEKFYDKAGNLITHKRYDETTTYQTHYNYNDIYQLESVVSPGGKTTSYLYDDLGNISQKTSPDAGTTKFKYDKYGNLRFELNSATPPGEKGLIFCKYDKVGRLLIKGVLTSTYGFNQLDADLDYSVNHNGLGPFENYLTNIDKFLVVNMYDKYERTGVFSELNGVSPYMLNKQNLKGRLVATAFRDKLTDPWSYKVYAYDARGRISNMWVYDRNDYNPRRIINEYDNFGNIVKQNVNSTMYYWYEYDVENRLKYFWSNHTDSKTTANLETIYFYDDSGLETTQYSNLGTGHTLLNHSVYDNRGRMTIRGGQIENSQYPDSWLTIFNQDLTYFNNSNIHYENIENNADPGWDNLSFSYTYDGLNRLKSRVWPGHPAEQYEYDLDGNLTSKERTGKEISYSFVSGSNKLSSVNVNSSNYNFSYDYKGNLTFDGYRNISLLDYDHRNLPLQMTKSSDIYKFGYDDTGNRVYKWSASSAEYYLRDHTGRELLVYDLYTKRVKMANLYGNGLMGRVDVTWDSVWVEDGEGFWYWQYIRADDRCYYVKDHLGSIRMTLDESGEIIGAQDYYPFGEIMRGLPPAGMGTNDKYKFTGKERDEGTTNYDYFGARYYDSELGRWHTVDPLADKYPGWSPYNYTLNNPLNVIDPNGMDTTSASATASYDFESDIETITETITQTFNAGTEDFAIVTTTTTAEIYGDGGVSYSQQVSSFTNSGTITVDNNNVNIENFSESAGKTITKALNLKTSTGFGFCQTLGREYNATVTSQSNIVQLFNFTTTVAFPMNFTKSTAIVDAINLGNSGYNIFKSLKPDLVNVNGNLTRPLYKKKR